MYIYIHKTCVVRVYTKHVCVYTHTYRMPYWHRLGSYTSMFICIYTSYIYKYIYIYIYIYTQSILPVHFEVYAWEQDIQTRVHTYSYSHDYIYIYTCTYTQICVYIYVRRSQYALFSVSSLVGRKYTNTHGVFVKEEKDNSEYWYIYTYVCIYTYRYIYKYEGHEWVLVYIHICI